MIDIIIPAYNAHNTIRRALYSILSQTIRNKIKIYIVDDCSEKGYDDEIREFKELLNITILKTSENSGPGVSRQCGIDNSKSKYIIFLDADDVFYNCFSVEYLYNFIVDNNCNAVCSNFLEECEDNVIVHGFNDIWMHGKIYKRNFIESNNIKFNNTSQNEDTGFNHIISIVDEFKYLDEITYIWRLNKDSITRKNDYEYSFSGLEGYVYNVCYSVEEVIRMNVKVEKIASVIISTMYEMYFNYLKYINDSNVYLISIWSKKLKKLFLEYGDKLPNYKKCNIIKNEFFKSIDNLNIISYLNNKFTFDDFMNSIEEE